MSYTLQITVIFKSLSVKSGLHTITVCSLNVKIWQATVRVFSGHLESGWVADDRSNTDNKAYSRI